MKRTWLVTLSILVAVAVVAAAGGDDVPEEVTIGTIADWFAPVVFSHGFHAELTDCADCHHNSDGLPIPCADCHAAGPEEPGADMPALKLAYHRQCIDCHAAMEAGPRGCDDCHDRQRLPEGPELAAPQP